MNCYPASLAIGDKTAAAAESNIGLGLGGLVRRYWNSPLDDDGQYDMREGACTTKSELAWAREAWGVSGDGVFRDRKTTFSRYRRETLRRRCVAALSLRGYAHAASDGNNLKRRSTDGGQGLSANGEKAWPHGKQSETRGTRAQKNWRIQHQQG